MANTDFKSVEHYIASRPAADRPTLQRVRSAIWKAIPAAEEGISYQIPVYKLPGGAMVIYFAGWKEHYSLYPATAGVIAAFERELAPYELSKGTIRFPLSKPVPVKLIVAIAKLRAREAAELATAKKVAKAKKKKAPKKAAKIAKKRTRTRR